MAGFALGAFSRSMQRRPTTASLDERSRRLLIGEDGLGLLERGRDDRQGVGGHRLLDQREQLALLQPHMVREQTAELVQVGDRRVGVAEDLLGPLADRDVVAQHVGDERVVRIAVGGEGRAAAPPPPDGSARARPRARKRRGRPAPPPPSGPPRGAASGPHSAWWWPCESETSAASRFIQSRVLHPVSWARGPLRRRGCGCAEDLDARGGLRRRSRVAETSWQTPPGNGVVGGVAAVGIGPPQLAAAGVADRVPAR